MHSRCSRGTSGSAAPIKHGSASPPHGVALNHFETAPIAAVSGDSETSCEEFSMPARETQSIAKRNIRGWRAVYGAQRRSWQRPHDQRHVNEAAAAG